MDGLLGEDEIERNIEGLREDGTEVAKLEADADHQGPAQQGCECSVVVAAAVAQAVTGIVKADNRHQEHIGDDRNPSQWTGNAAGVAGQDGIGIPEVKLQRTVPPDDDRKGGPAAGSSYPLRDCGEFDFAFHRPVETNCLRPDLRCREGDSLEDGHTSGRMRGRSESRSLNDKAGAYL
jgi:hypothetical protein